MRLIVNGAQHDVTVPAHETLVTTLRDRLHFTGTKLVCGRGECGACTVLLDGTSVYSCLTLTAACDGQRVTTIEGIGTLDALHELQAAFITHDAVQCGFCTPGQILAAAALLDDVGNPTEEQVVRGMSGNLCRCGTYPKIVRAVLDVARQRERRSEKEQIPPLRFATGRDDSGGKGFAPGRDDSGGKGFAQGRDDGGGKDFAQGRDDTSGAS